MMQLINTGSVALAAGAKIPLSVDYNTNAAMLGYDVGANEIVFLQPGIYKIIAQVVFSATAAGLNTILARSSTTGGNVPGMTSSYTTTTANDAATYVVLKNVRINRATPPANARINFATLTAGEMTNAVVTIEKIR